MKIERTRNASRNILFGGMLKIYQTLVPFIMRTVMIYFMGVQYLGLNSLFVSVLQVLNLAELGVGSAMVYSMYKPIAEDDKYIICALMRLYRIYYRVIGSVIAVIGIMIVPFIPNLVKSGIPPDINIYVLYLLNLATTVLSYWLFAYKNCLLSAHQRTDVTSKITIFTNTIQYGLQLIAVCIFRNYYLFIIIALATQAFTNIFTAFVVNKMYPDYVAKGKLHKKYVSSINQKVRDLFTAKIGGIIVNSADSIVISAYLGLTALAIYQNYFYILTSIIGIVAIIFNSCTAGIGNSIIVETKEKNYNDLNIFTFIIVWISGFCFTCLMCLYQPFMDIWVGKELELEFNVVICLCIYYFIYEINQLLNTYKDAAGIWHEDRFRPLVTAIINLVLNLILVQFWGIYGVILSTVLSMLFVGMPWLLYNLFTVLFSKSQLFPYLKRLIKYVVISCIACLITYLVCTPIQFSKWTTLIVKGTICCIVPNVIFFLVYRKNAEFQAIVQLVDKMTNGKFLKAKIDI